MIIKAAAGGGGRGMRIVRKTDELATTARNGTDRGSGGI